MALSFLQATVSTANATEYTFSDQNFGTESAGRHIIVAIGTRGAIAGTAGGISATIGGVAATMAAPVEGTSDGTNASFTALAIAAVPTGTSGDVVVTFDATMLRCGIGMWEVTNVSGTTAHDTATSIADDPTGSLDVPAGGFVVGVSFARETENASWTGITENYDAVAETIFGHSGASDTFAEQQTGLTVTCDWLAPVAGMSCGSFASWGPEDAGGLSIPIAMYHYQHHLGA